MQRAAGTAHGQGQILLEATTQLLAIQESSMLPRCGEWGPAGVEAKRRVFTRREGGFSADSITFHLRSKLYTADLESGLHYLLRVELAAHKALAGAELNTLKDFVTVAAKVRGL